MKLEQKFDETVDRLKEQTKNFMGGPEMSGDLMSPIAKIISVLEKTKKEVLLTIENKIDNPKHQQYYIDYIIGYLTTKPNAFIEDIESAVDVAKFLRENKHLYEERGINNLSELAPKELGVNHGRWEEVMIAIKQKSKNEWIRMKNQGVLPNDVKIDIVYQDKKYTVYKIPRLSDKASEDDKELHHLKYCFVGKGTKWCTANAVGTYYSYYLKDDIYAVWENGQPKYQFSIKNNSVGQFMDVNDRSVENLTAELINILESLFQ